MSVAASPLTTTQRNYEESPSWRFFSVWCLVNSRLVLSSLKKLAKSLLTVSFKINKQIQAVEDQTTVTVALVKTAGALPQHITAF